MIEVEDISKLFNFDSYNSFMDFTKSACDIFDNSDIAKNVAVMDYICNLNPKCLWLLCEASNYNENMMRSLIVYFSLAGADIKKFKEDNKEAQKVAVESCVNNGAPLIGKKGEFLAIIPKLGDTLCKYLKDKDIDEIDKRAKEDYTYFVDNFDKVQNAMLDERVNHNFPLREFMITNMFTSDYTCDNMALLNKLYKDVMLQNKRFSAFDYNLIFQDNADVIGYIKGIYKHFNRDTFDAIFDDLSAPNAEIINYLINEVCNLNKDDKDGLIWFLDEVDSSINDEFRDYLIKKNEHFRNFKEKNNQLYENIVNRLMRGDINIGEKLLEKLGSTEPFLTNYDYFLTEFMTTDNQRLQEKLCIPLIAGLIEKLKNKNNLELRTIFTSSKLDNKELGHYVESTNEIYVNPNVFHNRDDLKSVFVNACDTVFHEIRHAKQFVNMKNSKEFDFSNLLMCIDYYLKETGDITGYYINNYADLSFEKDARETAHVETMRFFKNYPEAKRMLNKEKFEYGELSDYVRKRDATGLMGSYAIINEFIDDVNSLSSDKELLEYALNNLRNYPVMEQFFDFNENGISIKPEEYFDEKLKEFENMPNGYEKRNGIYSVNAFRYALKVGKYFEDKVGFTGDYDPEKVVEDIGKGPVR